MDTDRIKSNRLLSKILDGTANPEEMREFANWLKVAENEYYFEAFKDVWHQTAVDNISKNDLDIGKKKFLEYTKHKKKSFTKTRNLYYSISIAATILILISIEIYIFQPKSDSSHQSELVYNNIRNLSINDSITLKLSDGNIINIQKYFASLFNTEGAEILINKSQNPELTYQQSQILNQTNLQTKFHQVSVPKGKRFSITFSDGSKVYLNSNSTIRYPVKFSEKDRAVTLNGTAYFEVKKSKVPFIVITNGMNVQVLGTSFEIKNDEQNNYSSVTLVEGSVKVNTKTIEKIIKPNQLLSFNKVSNKIDMEEVDAKSLTEWKNGILILDNLSFQEMTEKLSDWYGVEFITKVKVSDNEHFNGRFDVEDLQDALKILSISTKLNYKIIENRVIVTK